MKIACYGVRPLEEPYFEKLNKYNYELRLIPEYLDHENVSLGKAGRKRHMGIRPTVRGSVMNPNDHPHGGGEGKAPVGHAGPLTPWGKPALGYKTRKANHRTNKYIVKRRNSK